jgi:hypothetical protein
MADMIFVLASEQERWVIGRRMVAIEPRVPVESPSPLQLPRTQALRQLLCANVSGLNR